MNKLKIIEIIKSFWKKIKKKKIVLIEEKSQNEIKEKEKFLKSIYSEINTDNLVLKNKLENNLISVNDLSIFEVLDMIDLYE